MHNYQTESVEHQAGVERLANTFQALESTLSARASFDPSTQDIAEECGNGVMSATDNEFASSIEFIAQAWPYLLPHIREAIFALIESSSPSLEENGAKS